MLDDEPLANRLSAFAPDMVIAHDSGQMSLEILGSRLAGDELFDDELQETSYNG